MPGGALTGDNRWVEPRYRSKFLFPVRALSKVFRGKFIEGLKEARADGILSLPPDMEQLQDRNEFELWINKLVSRDWVVYCKPPFGDAEEVVLYIGQHTHRVAISNNRIIDVAGGEICFKYKDYKDDRKAWKEMRLNALEFIRRFLWHLLPSGFHKIRHYGFLANGRLKNRISIIKRLLQLAPEKDLQVEIDDWRITCPRCEKGSLIPRMIVTRFGQIMTAFAVLMKFGHGSYVLATS